MKRSSAGGRHPVPLWDGRMLKRWRLERRLNAAEAGQLFDVSQATYYRLEAGQPPTLDIANKIVRITHGAIKYRDLWPGFNPSYA